MNATVRALTRSLPTQPCHAPARGGGSARDVHRSRCGPASTAAFDDKVVLTIGQDAISKLRERRPAPERRPGLHERAGRSRPSGQECGLHLRRPPGRRSRSSSAWPRPRGSRSPPTSAPTSRRSARSSRGPTSTAHGNVHRLPCRSTSLRRRGRARVSLHLRVRHRGSSGQDRRPDLGLGARRRARRRPTAASPARR